MTAKAEELIAAMKGRYELDLPERYVEFLESGEHARYPKIKFDGHIRGGYDLDFLHPDLADVVELGMSHGITDIEDANWDVDYAGYVPLAGLSHEEVPEPKMFLVIDARKEEAPVLLFDQESGFKLFPIANSLDAFLAALPAARADVGASFRP